MGPSFWLLPKVMGEATSIPSILAVDKNWFEDSSWRSSVPSFALLFEEAFPG